MVINGKDVAITLNIGDKTVGPLSFLEVFGPPGEIPTFLGDLSHLYNAPPTSTPIGWSGELKWASDPFKALHKAYHADAYREKVREIFRGMNRHPISEPPTDYHEWLDPAIWKEDPGDFWDAHQTERKRRKKLIGYENEKPLEPFLLHGNRHSHELSHFIVCDDRHVLDPWWGVNTWTFASGDEGRFADDDLLIEAEVLAIDYFLRGRDPVEGVLRELVRNANLKGIGRVMEFPEDLEDFEQRAREVNKKAETKQIVTWVANACVAKWGLYLNNPDSARRLLWAECVRKTNLVRLIRGMKPTWPNV